MMKLDKLMYVLCLICSVSLLATAQTTVIVNPGQSIQTAVNAAAPGTTIRVTAGTYNQKVSFSAKSGTNGNLITLVADAGVVLTGAGLAPSGRQGLITIKNSNYIRVEGFDVQNFITGGGQTPCGILVEGSASRIEIINNKIHNIRNNSTCKDPCGEGAHGLAVFGTTTQGITDLLIQGNEVYGNVLQASESVVINGNVDRFQVLNNNVHDNNNIGFDFIGYEGECSGCGANDRVRNGLVRGNTASNNSSTTNPWYSNSGSAGGFYVDGGQYIIFDRNRSTGNDLGFEFASEHPGKATEDILMTNNFIYNNKDVGVALGGYESGLGEARRIQVYNNSFYKNKGWGSEVTLQYKVINCQFDNNIFFGEGTAAESYESIGTGNTGNVWGKNIWWGTSTASTGLPGTKIIQNPLYVAPASGDLTIQSTSPAINAGTLAPDITTWTSIFWDTYFPPSGTIPANGLADINNEARIVTGAIDLGADEFNGATPQTPVAPSSLTATANSSSQITLAWIDNASNETGFTIERSLSASAGFAVVGTVGSNVTSYSNTGLAAGTTYYYRVFASNAAGNSGYSAVATATTTAVVTVPAEPSSLTATANSSSQITLAWIDNASNETGFMIERSLSASTGFAVVGTVGSNVTSYINTGLAAGTTYYYRVFASNAAGNSGYSAVATATTTAVVTIPAAPSSLTATANSSSHITLAWIDNASNETGFTIERSSSASAGFAVVGTVGSNVTSYSNTGLAAATTYYYRVSANNAAGTSSFSNTANATTQSGGGTVITVDGNASDWAAVVAISTAGVGGLTTLKAYSDATTLYLLAQGTTSTNYIVFINVDNLASTGFNGGLWAPEGSDYSLENGVLYKYNGTGSNWSWTKTGVTQTGVKAVKNTSTIEAKLPKASLTGLASTIKLGVDSENSSWTTVSTIPQAGGAMATYTMGAAREQADDAVAEEQTSDSFYPNPSTGTITYSFDNTDAGVREILLYNQQGDLVLHVKPESSSRGKNNVVLHLEDFPAGLYVIMIKKGGNVTSQRIMLQK